MTKLRIATAQFPVCADIGRNLKYMRELTRQTRDLRGDVIHFSETCLGGYAGAEFKDWDTYDWKLLASAEQSLLQLSKELRIGIIYGIGTS